VAEGYLRRAVAVDPSREGAQRELMRALAVSGSYAAALQTYRELRLHLHRELNAEPDPQARALFDQIRSATRPQAGSAAAWVRRVPCDRLPDCRQAHGGGAGNDAL
jgi:DNA-binding SARP family transcriptional activator